MAVTSTTGVVNGEYVTFTIPAGSRGAARGAGIIIYIDYTVVGENDDGLITISYAFQEASLSTDFFNHCLVTSNTLTQTAFILPGAVGKYRLPLAKATNEEAVKVRFRYLTDSSVNVEFKIEQPWN